MPRKIELGENSSNYPHSWYTSNQLRDEISAKLVHFDGEVSSEAIDEVCFVLVELGYMEPKTRYCPSCGESLKEADDE